MRLATIALSVGLTLAALPTSAAQPELARKEAVARFEEGNQAYAGGHYEEARVKFNQAWVNYKRPNVLFNLARAEQLTGHLLESARHYREYQRLVDPKITPKDRESSAKYLAEIRQRVGRVAVSAPKGTTVTIDGERVDDADLAEPVDVTAGAHTVAGSWAGKSKQVDVVVAAGVIGNATFVFDDAAASLTPTPTPVGTTSATASPFTPPPKEQESSGTSGRIILGWTLVGVGAAAAGVGLGFVVASNSAASDRDRLKADPAAGQCPSSSTVCSDLKDAADSRVSRANAAKVFLIAGGATLVGGIVVLLLPGRGSSASAAIAPFVGPSVGGVSAFGRF